jgi:phospholipase/carboxylesterase
VQPGSRQSVGDANRGRLTARPSGAPSDPIEPGLHKIVPPGTREALLYIPAAHGMNSAYPLIVSLHGAGGAARHGIDILQAQAEQHGFAVLAPSSQRQTWEGVFGGYGPDVAALDFCLSHVCKRLHVRSETVAVSGFSDDASYALSIGLSNGSLFHHIIAFSPGFVTAGEAEGKPRIFVSPGSRDTVLPVDRCSRVLIPRLRRGGYSVAYHEFDGPHTVPEKVKADAMRWWRVG